MTERVEVALGTRLRGGHLQVWVQGVGYTHAPECARCAKVDVAAGGAA